MGEADLGETVRLLAYVCVLFFVLTPTALSENKPTSGLGTAVTYSIARPHAPAWFVPKAVCVHRHEEHWTWAWSDVWHPHYSYWNGYYTGMQFAPGTWAESNRLLHRHDPPRTWSRRIVILHAYAIVRARHGSWRDWKGTADVYCGLPVY